MKIKIHFIYKKRIMKNNMKKKRNYKPDRDKVLGSEHIFQRQNESSAEYLTKH
jgi:hypothetical protein